MAVLDKISLNPSQSVTFVADATKQQFKLQLDNGSDKAVLFKMKSTRPGLFKMRPVYDFIPAKKFKHVELTFKGFKPGQKPGAKDHFTIVMAAVDAVPADVKGFWEKNKAELADGEIKKKIVKIVWA